MSRCIRFKSYLTNWEQVCAINGFADDTQIFSSSYDYNELIDKLNSEPKNISDWLARAVYHLTKTKFMIIGSTYNLSNKVYNNPVMLNNKPLSRTSIFECLGYY